MTSVATVAGHTPLIFATGAGAGSRNSIGIVLVSGMFLGTFLTLFVVPTLYMLIAQKHVGHTADVVDDGVIPIPAGDEFKSRRAKA
jgi:multidrug efflux pump